VTATGGGLTVVAGDGVSVAITCGLAPAGACDGMDSAVSGLVVSEFEPQAADIRATSTIPSARHPFGPLRVSIMPTLR
jgi:hypothetical protein